MNHVKAYYFKFYKIIKFQNFIILNYAHKVYIFFINLNILNIYFNMILVIRALFKNP